jgi:predicted DNA binding CopG/RHH family protein
LKEATVKVTLLLSKDSVSYFKKEAEKFHTPYQPMIRALLDKYTQHHAIS